MVEEVSTEFPKVFSKSFQGLVEPILISRTQVRVEYQSMPWLIKVNKDRCPVCGTVEKSKAQWCDPRPPEGDCDD